VKHTYGEDSVVKYECVGHYQKRIGTRLRKLKKSGKGKEGGKYLKCLTDSIIDKLQNYFGIALRSNTGGTVKQMADAIWGSFLHVASNEQRILHDLCSDTWCQYLCDIKNKTNLYKHGKGLPKEIIGLVKPIYNELTKAEKLEKCLHGLTQNQNESFNNLIWERAPKTRYIASDKLNFAVNDAICTFNNGRSGTLELWKGVGIEPGFYTTELCIQPSKPK